MSETLGRWVRQLMQEWISLLRLCMPRREAAETLRSIEQGQVIGFHTRHGHQAWFGIPFAAPPVGALRWKAPRPPEKWTGVRKALKPGPRAAQIGGLAGGFKRSLWGKPVGNEDCLYLNIWSPIETPAAPLPVMLWIHGGGNAAGAADISGYDLDFFSRGQDIVCVSINYRLGVFGWFRHPALTEVAETPEDASGNYGTLDIVQALRWVRANIGQFGGDPDNVTIFGESAGGANVLSLMLVPQARGLFHKVIAQSGVTACYSVEQAENDTDAPVPGHRFSSREIISLLLQRSGRASSLATARVTQDALPPAELRDFLYAQTPADLLSPFKQTIMGMYGQPRPIADGAVLPSCSWHEAFDDPARRYAVPLMIGCTRDEYKLFMAGNPHYVEKRFGKLPRIRDLPRYEREARYFSDLWRAAAVDEVAERVERDGMHDIFVYRFDWDGWPRPLGVDLPRLIGAGHGVDVPVLFGLFEKSRMARWLMGARLSRQFSQLGTAMRAYWIAFAQHGRPASDATRSLPEWKRWSMHGAPAQQMMLLDAPTASELRMTSEPMSIPALKQRLSEDPDLLDDENERMRIYASLFIDGIMGGFWDEQPFPPLSDYMKDGQKRSQVEALRPGTIF